MTIQLRPYILTRLPEEKLTFIPKQLFSKWDNKDFMINSIMDLDDLTQVCPYTRSKICPRFAENTTDMPQNIIIRRCFKIPTLLITFSLETLNLRYESWRNENKSWRMCFVWCFESYPLLAWKLSLRVVHSSHFSYNNNDFVALDKISRNQLKCSWTNFNRNVILLTAVGQERLTKHPLELGKRLKKAWHVYELKLLRLSFSEGIKR